MDHHQQKLGRKNSHKKKEAHQLNQRNVIPDENFPDILNPIFKISQHQGVKFSSRKDLKNPQITRTAVALPLLLLAPSSPRLQLPKKYSLI